MHRFGSWLRSASKVAAYGLVLVAGAVLAILLARALMVLAVVVAVVAAVLSAFSFRFYEWFEQLGEPRGRLRQARSGGRLVARTGPPGVPTAEPRLPRMG